MKTSFYILFFAIFNCTVCWSQNQAVFGISDNSFNQENCLTNTSDYSKFQLVVLDEDVSINDLDINVSVNGNVQNFNAIEAFNAFDFKFWLLTNNGFDSGNNLIILIRYSVGGTVSNETITICLQRVSVTDDNDRGDTKSPDYVTLDVYFGTDRNDTKNTTLNKRFGVKRSSLKYGIVEVSIPHDHRVGEIESPSIWKFEFSEDPSKHLMLQKVKLLDRTKFFKKLAEDIRRSDKKSSFLFVHGYNTSFQEAAKRTAQISYDLKFEGKPVFYSWPSQASTFRYGRDEKNIKWSQKNIKLFLEDYLSKSGADDIYLVAHSMGNRGLTKAIVDVMNENPNLKANIKEIILAAPDIDADVFKNNIAPKMVSSTEKPITLYVNSDDLALKASKLIHGNARAGDAGEKLVLIDGVETIDATGIDTSLLSHSYFADTNSIIADIFDIIKSGKRAINRKHLYLTKLKDKIYWKVKK
ncbi:MAG: alpha/beta hydrolase [Winogradskyella sp.]|uniref:alpha/beta hydrolase n=1 Tax=Winogradskyella sp. TaxID=1883156 RepID=UPI000F3EBE62|nr:alpha/beta hydrolase [Winogradskyella sp.]RNC86719.1 MAG: alpha/beta hydrolase [Winogradskyella sp.]